MIEINYDGAWPKLCDGNLIVTINGCVWEFGDCLVSGGRTINAGYGDYHIAKGEWKIHPWPAGFPFDLRVEVLKKVNEVVPHGCCGGCL